MKAMAMEDFRRMAHHCQQRVEREDAMHDQEIKAYIDKAVAHIARQCGTDQATVWAELEYWSRSKA